MKTTAWLRGSDVAASEIKEGSSAGVDIPAVSDHGEVLALAKPVPWQGPIGSISMPWRLSVSVTVLVAGEAVPARDASYAERSRSAFCHTLIHQYGLSVWLEQRE